jgi:hypothetical protein
MKTVRSILSKAIGGVKADDVLHALSFAGYVCVPREPSQAVIDKVWTNPQTESPILVWRDMIKALDEEI